MFLSRLVLGSWQYFTLESQTIILNDLVAVDPLRHHATALKLCCVLMTRRMALHLQHVIEGDRLWILVKIGPRVCLLRELLQPSLRRSRRVSAV